MFMMDLITCPNCCRILAVVVLVGLHAALVLAVPVIPVPVLHDVLVVVLAVLVLVVLVVRVPR